MKSDLELRQDITEALARGTGTRMQDVSVTAEGGIVVLRGEVLTFADLERADQLARGVTGVKAVINELTATEDPITLSLDSILEEEAAASLRALGTWAAAIAVSVAERVVTLTGDVEDVAQVETAREAVAIIPGVRAVVNLLRPVGEAVADAVARRITSAFQVEGLPGAGKVAVEVRDHLATLTGTLDSVAERDVAVAAAESTPGITGVDDRLKLTQQAR